jgi:hypothetical protein
MADSIQQAQGKHAGRQATVDKKEQYATGHATGMPMPSPTFYTQHLQTEK